jgi:hypothetical protein
VSWESVVAFLNAYVDAQEFFDTLLRERGTLPEEAIPHLERLIAVCRGTSAKIAIATVLRDALPMAALRAQSGFYAIAAECPSELEHVTRARARHRVPDVVRITSPIGKVSFGVPDYTRGVWTRLRWAKETSIVDQLLRANGRPVAGSDLVGLQSTERAWTDVVGGINDQFPGGRRQCFVETYGKGPRSKGQRRKMDLTDEQPDGRFFLVRSSAWSIANVILETVDTIEDDLAKEFGRPRRAAAS